MKDYFLNLLSDLPFNIIYLSLVFIKFFTFSFIFFIFWFLPLLWSFFPKFYLSVRLLFNLQILRFFYYFALYSEPCSFSNNILVSFPLSIPSHPRVILFQCRSATGMGGMCWLFCALLAASCCVFLYTLTPSSSQPDRLFGSPPPLRGEVWPCPQIKNTHNHGPLSLIAVSVRRDSSAARTGMADLLGSFFYVKTLFELSDCFNSNDSLQQVAGLLFPPSPLFLIHVILCSWICFACCACLGF